MAFDMSAMAGNRAGWIGGQTPVTPVTDLTAHVDGGQNSSRRTNAAQSVGGNGQLYDAVGIVAIALILLWVMGALSFRNHNL